MFMQRELYIKTGGFDEGCFMYADDIDLSYLVLKEGKQNYYVSATTVIHFKGESTLKDGKYMNRFKEAMQFFIRNILKNRWLLMPNECWYCTFAFKRKKETYRDTVETDHYIIVSNNAALYHQVAITLKKPVDWVVHLQDVLTIDQPLKNIEVLVDADTISYKDYIQFINQQKESNKSFKIRPNGSNFFIGSNDKNDKGEILPFSF